MNKKKKISALKLKVGDKVSLKKGKTGVVKYIGKDDLLGIELD
jgi:preprotein translocase subunit YajC